MADCFWTDLINCHEDCGESQATTFNLFLSEDDYDLEETPWVHGDTGGGGWVGEIYGDTNYGTVVPNDTFIGPTARALSIALPCRFLERSDRVQASCFGGAYEGSYILRPYFWMVPPAGGADALGWSFSNGSIECVSQSITNLDTSELLELTTNPDDGCGFYGSDLAYTPANRDMESEPGYDDTHPDDWLYAAKPVKLDCLYSDLPNIANGVLSIVCEIDDVVVSGQNLQVRKLLVFVEAFCPE